MTRRIGGMLVLSGWTGLACAGARGGVSPNDATISGATISGATTIDTATIDTATSDTATSDTATVDTATIDTATSDTAGCIVGVPAAADIERGAGSSLTVRAALPRFFVPTDLIASESGATGVVGVLPSGSFGDPHTKEPFHAYVAASFDERGVLRFARVVGSAVDTTERRPRIALDTRGLVAAATLAGSEGGREKIVIHAYDARGALRYERVFSGPRKVVVDALERSAAGGVLVAGHFDGALDGVASPAFLPARSSNAFVAELGTDGALRKVVVLPVGQVAALATGPGRIFVAARTDGAATIAGTRLPMSDGRLDASSLVTALDAKTLAPVWMVPLRPALARASLVVTREGHAWLGGLGDPPLLRFDPRGTTTTEAASPSAVLVEREMVDQPSWLATTQAKGEGGARGSVLGVHGPRGATRSFPMNVDVLDVAAAGSTQIALVVSPLPPTMHPHCSGPPGGSSSIVVLRRP